MRKDRAIKILVEICRVILGLTFIFSGFVKAIDPVGFSIKIGDYLTAFGLDFLSWLDTFAAFCIISIEFALGVCILLGVYRKLISVSLLLFMCVMTPLTLYLAIFNPVADCGCFGDALIISNWETFFKNLFLLTAAIIVFKYHKLLTPFYTYKAYWFVTLFSFFYCIGFCYYNYNHLPIIDFRPYKLGENIKQLMEIPENAPQDDYIFIYEKDGVIKEFTFGDVPAGDTTWTYVDAKLIKQGFIPVIGSFELYDKEHNNIADLILDNPEIAFLLISPKLEDANDEHIDLINNVYDYTQENKLSFFAVTASSEEEIAEWAKNTGADYPFLTADDVLLKTIIRSNPGLVMLKRGTILAKWHHNDIPSENQLDEIVSVYSDEALIIPQKENRPWCSIVLCFTLPLLLVWIYDFFRNKKFRRKKENINW